MRGLTLFIFFLISISLSAQTERKFIREGNKLYKDGKFSDAENSYRSATSKKSNSFEAAYNTANSLYKQGKYEDAAVLYDTLTKWKNDNDKQSKLYYNLGNSLVKAKKLNEGINAYKNSLKINPKDEDTKYNLSYAYKLLKQQEQQKQQNKDNKDKKDDKNKKDQDKKNKQDQKNDKNKDNKDNKDKKDQQNQQNQDNKDQNKKKEKQGAQPQISQEAAQQMLDAIQNDEKNVLKKLQEQKKQGQKVQVSKNW